MEVQDVEFSILVGLVELFHHRVAHILAVLHRITASGLAIVILYIVDLLVRHPPPGEVVDLVVLCQSLSEIGCCTCKAAHPLGIHRFPAEERYLK